MEMANKPTKTRSQYLSYLLRLWRENGDDRPQWRASLEWPRTERRQSFSTLAGLFAFLEQETGLDSSNELPAEEGGRGIQESNK